VFSHAFQFEGSHLAQVEAAVVLPSIQTQPVSSLQELEHPSPSTEFPSSQYGITCPFMTRPSAHISLHSLASVVDP
jgi:hypothetical protein